MSWKFLFKLLLIVAVIEILSAIWPHRIAGPFFGSFVQSVNVVGQAHYDGTYFSLSYPERWRAHDLTEDAGASDIVPQMQTMVGFGPGTVSEHAVIVSTAAKEAIQTALVRVESSQNRILADTQQFMMNDMLSTKLSFENTGDRTDMITYYLIPSRSNRIYTVRVHGPGAKDLDAAANMMLKSLQIK